MAMRKMVNSVVDKEKAKGTGKGTRVECEDLWFEVEEHDGVRFSTEVDASLRAELEQLAAGVTSVHGEMAATGLAVPQWLPRQTGNLRVGMWPARLASLEAQLRPWALPWALTALAR